MGELVHFPNTISSQADGVGLVRLASMLRYRPASPFSVEIGTPAEGNFRLKFLTL